MTSERERQVIDSSGRTPTGTRGHVTVPARKSSRVGDIMRVDGQWALVVERSNYYFSRRDIEDGIAYGLGVDPDVQPGEYAVLTWVGVEPTQAEVTRERSRRAAAADRFELAQVMADALCASWRAARQRSMLRPAELTALKGPRITQTRRGGWRRIILSEDAMWWQEMKSDYGTEAPLADDALADRARRLIEAGPRKRGIYRVET